MSELAITTTGESISIGTQIALSESAERARKSALLQACMVTAVGSANENQLATEVLSTIKTVLKEIEAARKAVKAPVIEVGKQIDAAAQSFTNALKEEESRIEELMRDYIVVEFEKSKAAAAQYNSRLTDLEREREAKLAQAADGAAIDAIKEEYDLKHAALGDAPSMNTAKGQMVKEEWKIVISDIHALYRAHPACVSMEPRLTEIKSLLDAGVKVIGVTAKKEVNITAKTQKSKVIDV